MLLRKLAGILMLFGGSIHAQKPEVFDVSKVVIGAQRLPTLYLYAVGKWSDAGEHAGPGSTEIQCYKALGFCNVANAREIDGLVSASLDMFDILRWDTKEVIAVDSSSICLVNTIRVDLVTKRVTLSSSDKGSKDPLCKGSDAIPTAVLWGVDDYVKSRLDEAKKKH